MSSLPNTLEEVANLDLNYIDQWQRDMIKDGLRAIVLANNSLTNDEINVWKYLSQFDPPPGKGFMFCDDKIISIIQNKMEVSHSGCSLAWTMRVIELIAKEGLPALQTYFNKQVQSN